MKLPVSDARAAEYEKRLGTSVTAACRWAGAVDPRTHGAGAPHDRAVTQHRQRIGREQTARAFDVAAIHRIGVLSAERGDLGVGRRGVNHQSTPQ